MFALLLSQGVVAVDKPACLILKHASASEQFWVSGANWRYVAGDFPKGMKWKSNVRDRDVRKIKELGGNVVIVQPNYTPSDLEQAQNVASVHKQMFKSNSPRK
ncbi:MAG: hypothetical protein JWO91_2890 [Acidobacteriaceae bacterium]|nr:hypothetical protein [Acidobacteriaceae bacterium]